MKEHEKCQKRAITDLSAPNGSQDIPLQSQEFEKMDLNMMLQMQCCKTMKK